MRINEIHKQKKVSGFIGCDLGQELQDELKYLTRKLHRKHQPSDYISFMNRHDCEFKTIHPQDQRYGVYNMFSVITQHITGCSIEECLDYAIDIEADNVKARAERENMLNEIYGVMT